MSNYYIMMFISYPGWSEYNCNRIYSVTYKLYIHSTFIVTILKRQIRDSNCWGLLISYRISIDTWHNYCKIGWFKSHHQNIQSNGVEVLKEITFDTIVLSSLCISKYIRDQLIFFSFLRHSLIFVFA